jgi:hypothetical protein
MNPAATPSAAVVSSWKHCYRAALLENDRSKVLQLIAEAERAIVARARELFLCLGDNVEEQEALDDALYALHAFRSTLLLNPSGSSISRAA